MTNNYKLDIFEKIEQISDEKVRNLAKEALLQAIKQGKDLEEIFSKQAIVDGVAKTISREVNKLMEGEN